MLIDPKVWAGLCLGGIRGASHDARYDVVTFDCYGTLIDWEDGIVSAFIREAAADGVALDRSQILAAYHEVEPEVEACDTGLTARCSRRRPAASRSGWDGRSPRIARDFCADSLPDWTPFPDTNPALVDLAAAGYRLGILSNVDDDLLGEDAASLRRGRSISS